MPEAPALLDVEHLYCGPCFDLGHHVALCGTSLEGAVFTSPHTPPPCVVCGAQPSLPCGNCGEEIAWPR